MPYNSPAALAMVSAPSLYMLILAFSLTSISVGLEGFPLSTFDYLGTQFALSVVLSVDI